MPFISTCCCEYIELTPCAGQTDPPRLFIHEDNIGATTATVVSYIGFCYEFDPATARTNKPAGAHELTGITVTIVDCATCLSDPGDGNDGDPGGGGGDPGGGGGGGGDPGGGGGGDPGGDPPPFICDGYKVTFCAGVDTSLVPSGLYICVDDSTAPGTYYGRYYGRCGYITVNGSPTTPPEGAVMMTQLGTYESCEECEGVYLVMICPNQIIPEGWGRYVVEKDFVDNMAEESRTWRQDGVCVRVSKFQSTQDAPSGAIRVTPPTSSLTCDTCVLGRIAELCPDQTNADAAPVLWVPDAWDTAVESWFNRGGWCYHYDPASAEVVRPAGSVLHRPTEDYASCSDCNCGKPIDLGIKVMSCLLHGAVVNATELWIHEDDVPAVFTFWDEDGVCRYAGPTFPLQPIPKGAKTTVPEPQFVSCHDCTSNKHEPPPPPPTKEACPEGEHDDGTGNCIDDDPDPEACADGFIWDPIWERCVPDCPEDHYFDGSDCVELPEDPDETPPCQPLYCWSEPLGRCVKCQDDPTDPPECPPGQVWNPETEECEEDEDDDGTVDPPPIPEGTGSLQLYRCAYTDSAGVSHPEAATDIWATLVEGSGIAGKVFNLGAGSTCACYRVSSVGRAETGTIDLSSYPGYLNCTACEQLCELLQLKECGGALVDKYVYVQDRILAGKNIAKVDGICYEAALSNPRTTIDLVDPEDVVNVASWHDSCDDEECAPPCTAPGETCDSGLASSYLVSGHVTVVDALDSSAICDADFSVTVTSPDPENCADYPFATPVASCGPNGSVSASLSWVSLTGWVLTLIYSNDDGLSQSHTLISCGNPNGPVGEFADDGSSGVVATWTSVEVG